ncbi:MAG: DUF3048 domain-containing protein [Ilumatobacteraceae bacterium]
MFLTVAGTTLLAACSKTTSRSSTTPATAASVAAVPPTTATTTTASTTTSTTVAETTTTIAPTTTVPPTPVYPITGLPVTDPAVAARQTLVVKIDNSGPARPQSGLNEADMVFEEIVNDSLTRFAFVYQSLGDNAVGPCRSGRIQDIDLMGMFNHPLFAWSGGNATVTAAIRASDLVDIGPSRASVYHRTSDRQVPHNLYSSTEALWSQTTPDAAPPAQIWQFRPDGMAPQGSPSAGVDVKLDSVDAGWRWDATDGLYLRTTDGRTHDDALSGQVSTNNVVVLSMEYWPGISDSPDAQTVGTGEAWVFSGGSYVHGTWTRDDRLKPFTLAADDGEAILLTPGRTFVELPRSQFGVSFVAPLPAA